MVAGMRLGWTKRAVTELVGVAEHTMGLTRLAQGLLLELDLNGTASENASALVDLIPSNPGNGKQATLLDEIEAVERNRLGIHHLPNIWRLVGRKQDYLETTWAKHQLLFAEGELELNTKLAVGLAVSMTNTSAYFIHYFKRAMEQRGFGDDAVFEVATVVDLYNSYNKVADGHMIESEQEVKDQLAY